MVINYNGTVKISDACISLKPNAGVSVEDNDVTKIIWDDETITEDTIPTNSEIVAEQSRLQAIEDAQAYARTRKAKYDLLNQDEMRFDDQANSTTTWVDAINAIKTAHPKP